MAVEIAALRTELQTDPNGYGYAQWIANGTDWMLRDLLNDVRAAISVRRTDIQPIEVLQAVDVADFVTGVSTMQGQYFAAVCQLPSITIADSTGGLTLMASNVLAMLKVNTASRNRLNALSMRNGSRAEQLFGANTSVTLEDIAQALRG